MMRISSPSQSPSQRHLRTIDRKPLPHVLSLVLFLIAISTLCEAAPPRLSSALAQRGSRPGYDWASGREDEDWRDGRGRDDEDWSGHDDDEHDDDYEDDDGGPYDDEEDEDYGHDSGEWRGDGGGGSGGRSTARYTSTTKTKTATSTVAVVAPSTVISTKAATSTTLTTSAFVVVTTPISTPPTSTLSTNPSPQQSISQSAMSIAAISTPSADTANASTGSSTSVSRSVSPSDQPIILTLPKGPVIPSTSGEEEVKIRATALPKFRDTSQQLVYGRVSDYLPWHRVGWSETNRKPDSADAHHVADIH